MAWRWPWTRRRKLTDLQRQVGQMIRASYDAAQTTNENSRHWANADALSAIAAGSQSVRATIRNRARYEIANNSFARGIVLTLSNDLVGTGPRLQVLGADGPGQIEIVVEAVAEVVGQGRPDGVLHIGSVEPHDGLGQYVCGGVAENLQGLGILISQNFQFVPSLWDFLRQVNEFAVQFGCNRRGG